MSVSLVQLEKMQSAGWRGQALGLGLGLASIAPAFAWTAHAMLGLHLHPGQWSGWASGFWAWAWVLALAPALEEWVMRLLLQSGFHEQLGRWGRLHRGRLNHVLDWRGHIANGATAVVFAALHMPANGLMALWWLLPALAIGEVWRRSASWMQCALLHAWFNACLVLMTALGGSA